MADVPPVTVYEICLHKADTSLSIVMKVNLLGLDDAKVQAAKMLLKGDLS